ncbi:MAG: glycosyltransferase family 2 protein [Candidatus Xenobia bacterium]
MIHLVLPAYNEANALPALLERIVEMQRELPGRARVVVVDDGSTDETAAVAGSFDDRLNVQVIRHDRNRGLPDALKTGLLEVLKQAGPSDIVVTMDSDDTHSPGLVFRMTRLIREGHDIVIASRYVPGARIRGLSVRRQFLSWAANVMFRILLPIPGVRDYTCGYRAYRIGFLEGKWERLEAALRVERAFSCMISILLELRSYDPIVAEVPLILRYDQKSGASKMDVQGTVRQTLRLLVRHLLRRA